MSDNSDPDFNEDREGHMTSQNHRAAALRSLNFKSSYGVPHPSYQRAQIHALLAIYEGLYELFGDGRSFDALRKLASHVE